MPAKPIKANIVRLYWAMLIFGLFVAFMKGVGLYAGPGSLFDNKITLSEINLIVSITLGAAGALGIAKTRKKQREVIE
ncbi:MAG: hypothetical protein V7752_21600 [Halopseudomonas sp.]